MRWLSFVPSKATLVLLFKAARRRVATQPGDIEELPNARIASATEELNKIADDIRDAQPELSLMTVPRPEISTPAH
jgi:hypothetical protein